MSPSIDSRSSSSPAGRPSTMHVRPGPWDSPAVVSFSPIEGPQSMEWAPRALARLRRGLARGRLGDAGRQVRDVVGLVGLRALDEDAEPLGEAPAVEQRRVGRDRQPQPLATRAGLAGV